MSLKNDNQIKLFGLVSAALLICSWLQFGSIAKNDLTDYLLFGGCSALMSVVIVMFTHVLPSHIKHKIIFTRIKDELPASRVHYLCQKDPRILYEEVHVKWPEVFSESTPAKTRNALWYKHIYRPVQDQNSVVQAHQHFLLYRDVFSSLAIISTGIVLYDIYQFYFQNLLPAVNSSIYVILFLFLFLSMISARNNGNRYVVTAVAVHSE